MTDINWDDMASSVFVSWTEVGDTVEGLITGMVAGTDFNGNPCPEIHLTTPDEEERIITCGTSNLKAQIVAIKPEVGDSIRITFSSEKPTGKGNPLKVFTVEHKPGGMTPVETTEKAPF